MPDVMEMQLEDVKGMPVDIPHTLAYYGIRTVEDMIRWAGDPDLDGRMGLSKCRAFPHIGPDKADRLECALNEVGVDISQPRVFRS